MNATWKVRLTIEAIDPSDEFSEAEPVAYTKYVKARDRVEAEYKASDLARDDFIEWYGTDVMTRTDFLSAQEVAG